MLEHSILNQFYIDIYNRYKQNVINKNKKQFLNKYPPTIFYKRKIQRDKYDGCQTDKFVFMELVPEKHTNFLYLEIWCCVQK